MQTKPTLKRILWSVNPFLDDQSLVRRTAQSLAQLSQQWNAEILPVYILSDVPPNVKLLPLLIQDVQLQAREELSRILRRLKRKPFDDLKLLVSSTTQLRDQVHVLTMFARERHADVIAVSTRARKGPRRWLLGSFTEALMQESPVPLYVINPLESKQTKFQHILFPTDFSEASRLAFRQVIAMAAEMRARVTLFHKVSNQYSPVYEVGYGSYAAYSAYFQELISERKAEAQDWIAQAAQSGVRVRLLVDYHTDRSTAESIVWRSRTRGGMIAMAGHSGMLSHTLMGGITRQVVRTAEVPVWVIHPEPVAARARLIK